MRLLWRDRWLEVPAYQPGRGGLLLEIDATVPLLPLREAGGRTIRRPALKVVRFLLSDGPRATLRKARTKRAEPAFLGDYQLVAALGSREHDGERCLALAPRSAPCAESLPVHPDLCCELPGAGESELRRFAAALRPALAELEPLTRQNYLYSGERPPERLRELLAEAAAAGGGRGEAGRGGSEPIREGALPAAELLRPERGDGAGPVAGRGSGRARGAPVALLGAGDYARMEIVPALRRAGLTLQAVCDREPQIAALAAADGGFAHATTDPLEAIGRLGQRGVVVVATYHDSHAALAAAALDAGHRVLLEKPAVVTREDLEVLLAAAERGEGELEVGFNRRYNPLVRRAAAALGAEEGPVTIVASIREVEINPDHWYLWPNQGTRVAGNLCHWIDLAVSLLGPGPRPRGVSVSPQVVEGEAGRDAERAFAIDFDDGSVATLIATGRGDEVRGVQEHIEARRGLLTVHLDDLWRLRTSREGRIRRRRTVWRDKGHQRMYREMLGRFRRGEPSAYPLADLERVCAVQLAATELVRSSGSRAPVEPVEPVRPSRAITG